MQGRMIVLRVDGTVEAKDLKQASGILSDLQGAVWGYIETVPAFDTYRDEDGRLHACVALCNEEGKLKQLPVNERATILWRGQCATSDTLVGDVVVLYGDAEFMRDL
jgi:hypothetical protein